MYPRNNASPPPLTVGQVVQISDGAVQTAGASARVKTGTGAWGASSGTLDVDATSGQWFYTPTQGETNAATFQVAVYKASCLGCSVTVATTASATAGNVVLSAENHAGATVPTVTTLTNAPPDSSGVTTLLSRLSALRAGYLDNLSAGAVALASTFTGITSLKEWLGLMAGKQSGNATARTELRSSGAGSGTFDETTDSLEATRDNVGTAGAGLTAAPDQAGVTTLLGRLSALRAGYLDNLSAGAVALASTFSGITSLKEWLGLIAGKQVGNATARTELRSSGAGSGTYDETTDSQEATRDNMGTAQTGDAYAIVNSGVHGNAALKVLIDAVDDFVDTEVASILAAVDTEVASILAAVDTEVAAILAAVDTEVGAIKTQTDKIQFNGANMTLVDVREINDTTVLGNGGVTPWGP